MGFDKVTSEAFDMPTYIFGWYSFASNKRFFAWKWMKVKFLGVFHNKSGIFRVSFETLIERNLSSYQELNILNGGVFIRSIVSQAKY